MTAAAASSRLLSTHRGGGPAAASASGQSNIFRLIYDHSRKTPCNIGQDINSRIRLGHLGSFLRPKLQLTGLHLLASMQGLYYTFIAQPNPAGGLLDFYVTGPLLDNTSNRWQVGAAAGPLAQHSALCMKWCTCQMGEGHATGWAMQPFGHATRVDTSLQDVLLSPCLVTLQSRNFVLRDKLGGGNFGVTFEGVRVDVSQGWKRWHGHHAACQHAVCLWTALTDAEAHQHHGTWVLSGAQPALPPCMHAQGKERGTVTQRGTLTPEQKKRRVVLKRVNQDREGARWVPGGRVGVGRGVCVCVNPEVAGRITTAQHS
jgi:hypothetical protein